MGFKISQLFTEYPFIWLNKVKSVKRRKRNTLHIKFILPQMFILLPIFPPFGLSHLGWQHHLQPPTPRTIQKPKVWEIYVWCHCADTKIWYQRWAYMR